MVAKMKKWFARARMVLVNPQLRPLEVWLFRAVVVYLAAKLGVTVDHVA